MALADSIGGLCAWLNLPDGSSGTTTIESKTLRAVTAGHVDAIAHLTARATQSRLVLTAGPH
jgi:1,4-dihydroxy-2-naphthoyl-CoA hydrolase